MNGLNIIVTKKVGNNYTAIAATKTNEIQTECETIEVASANDGEWKHHIAGRKEWGLSVSYLISAVSNLDDLLLVGSTYKLRIQNQSGSDYIQGDAILKSVKQTASIGNLVQGSFQFVGNGALEDNTNTNAGTEQGTSL